MDNLHSKRFPVYWTKCPKSLKNTISRERVNAQKVKYVHSKLSFSQPQQKITDAYKIMYSLSELMLVGINFQGY